MASKAENRSVNIYINGTAADQTLKQIEGSSRALRNQLGRLVPDTEAFKNKMAELKSVNRQLNTIKDDIKGVGGAFGWLKTEIGKLGAVAAGLFGFSALVGQFRNIVSMNAVLSDSISDIQKTTGMSELAVRRLQAGFKNINTRSSIEEINNLAVVAGKLGIAGEEDVMGFVRAADQINVALGKDLGNAEQAINDLGKLTEIFKIKDAYGLEQALLKTGSAINDLGAAGTANEGYLVEFTKRMGGIAPAANISIQNVIGLAATMDELGQNVEASSTAIGQFIVGLGKDIPKFAAVAGMGIKEFSELLKNDGNAALIAVLKNTKSTGEGLAGLAANMGMIGADGARATASLGVLSNNLELLQKRQEMSNASFAKGTSLTAEYNIKNNNFAATLEKLGKKFNSLTANVTFTDFLIKATIATSNFLDFLGRNAAAIANFIKVLTLAGIAWTAYSLATGIATAQKALWIRTLISSTTLTNLQRIATISLATAKALLSGNLAKAAQGWRLLNAVMAINPWGLALAGIAALTAAFIFWGNKVSEAVRIQQTLNDISATAEKSILKERMELERLLLTLKNKNSTREQEIAAVKRLREVMPDHLKGYSDEEIMAGKATDAVNKHISALTRQARATAATNKMASNQEDIIDIETKTRTGWSALSYKDKVAYQFKSGKSGDFARKQYFKDLLEQKRAKEAENAQIEEMYSKDINFVSIKKGDDDGQGGTAGKTLASLKAKLEDLRKAKEQAIVGSKEFVSLQKQIKDQEAEIEKYDPSKSSGGKAQNDTKAKFKEALKERGRLDEEFKKLNLQRLNDQLSANEKEVKQEADKYDALIAKEKAYLSLPKATKEGKATANNNIDQYKVDKEKATTDLRARQEEELTAKIDALRMEMTARLATELEKEKVLINKFYDDQERNFAGNETALADLKIKRIQDLNAAELREKDRLEAEKLRLEEEYENLTGNKDFVKLMRINKRYDAEVQALKDKFSQELQATKEFQEAIDAIEKNRTAETQAVIKATTRDKLDAALGLANDVASALANTAANNRRVESDIRLKEIEKQRNEELASKNLTEKQKKKINDKYDKEAAAEKLQAWKADQQAAIKQTIIAGLLASIKALPNFLLSSFALGASLAAAAEIGAQKPPEFEQGGYSAISNRDPQGWVKRPTLFNNSASGRAFSAGEKFKTEYIISSAQLQDPVIADFVGAMEANRGIRRFEAGGYSRINSDTGAAAQSTGSNPDLAAQNYLLAKQNELLTNMTAKFNDFSQKPWEFPMRLWEEKYNEMLTTRKNAQA